MYTPYDKSEIDKSQFHDNDDDHNNNNSILFFIIYVPSRQPQCQLQTQHRVDIGNYIIDKHDIKSKTNYRQALEGKHINAEK
jgi:hypothetical protein